MTTSYRPSELWEDFKKYFFESLPETQAQLSEFWHVSPKKRTHIYQQRHNVLERVANKMECSYDAEAFSVDAVFYRDLDRHRFPVVFVESENACMAAHHEVSKLVSIAAPLRVLITVAQWSKNTYPEKHLGEKRLMVWDATIRKQCDGLEAYGIAPQGVLGFLVGECDKAGWLRYYHFCYDFDAKLWEPADQTVDRNFAKIEPNSRKSPAGT